MILFFALMTVCLSACAVNKANAPDDKFSVEGVFLKGKDSCFIITDDNSPIILESNDENIRQLLGTFENGDRIMAYIGGIEETYPARTVLYEAELLEKGKSENINSETLDRLKESGWVE